MNVFGHINFQTVILYLTFPFFEFIANSPMTFSWTDQQRAAAVKEGWGYLLLLSARPVIIVFSFHFFPVKSSAKSSF
jgi:hypothetical protein